MNLEKGKLPFNVANFFELQTFLVGIIFDYRPGGGLAAQTLPVSIGLALFGKTIPQDLYPQDL